MSLGTEETQEVLAAIAVDGDEIMMVIITTYLHPCIGLAKALSNLIKNKSISWTIKHFFILVSHLIKAKYEWEFTEIQFKRLSGPFLLDADQLLQASYIEKSKISRK